MRGSYHFQNRRPYRRSSEISIFPKSPWNNTSSGGQEAEVGRWREVRCNCFVLLIGTGSAVEQKAIKDSGIQGALAAGSLNQGL